MKGWLLPIRPQGWHICAVQHRTYDLGASDTEGNLQAGRGLVKDLLLHCAPLILHLTTMSYIPDSTNISLVSASDYGFENELYKKNLDGELDIEGNNDDDARQNASYGENL